MQAGNAPSQDEMGTQNLRQELELLQALREQVTEAAMDAGGNLTGPSTRLLLTCITLLEEREKQLAAYVAPQAPAPSRPDGLPERRGSQRTTLTHVSLLRDVDPITLKQLLTSCSFRDLAPDEILLAPERPNRHLYVIMSGSVRVHIDELGGPPNVEIGVGECVGELSILGDTHVTAYVVGNEAARLMVIDQDLLWLLIDHSPQLARKLLYTLSHRVGSDNQILRSSLRRQRESEMSANLDALTGIPNRRALSSYFEELLDQGLHQQQPICLMMMDIDHFKRFNDTHGHLMGDNVLCEVASILAENAGPGLAARYGGEEFSVLVPGFDLEQTCQLANLLREKISAVQLMDANGEPIPRITISIGVKLMEPHDTLKSLVHDADTALYCAKRSGRNCVRQHPAPPLQA